MLWLVGYNYHHCIFYRILRRRYIILIFFGIFCLNRVLIIGEIIHCCWWSNIWWFSCNGWYDVDNGGGKEYFLVAPVLWSLLTCNFHVVVSFSTHIFVPYVRMWDLYHFSTFNCVCHQILKILLIYNRLSGNLFIFCIDFWDCCQQIRFFKWKKYFNFSKVHGKIVPSNIFGACSPSL